MIPLRVKTSAYPYGEAWPGGPWIHSGNLPGTLPSELLYIRVSADSRIVGVLHEGALKDHAFYWRGDQWVDLGLATGISPCAFGPSASVYVVSPTGLRVFSTAGDFLGVSDKKVGSQGIRWVRPNGSVVTGDESYANTPTGIYQYTDTPSGLRIGQGPDETGGGVLVFTNGATRRVTSGTHRFIRVNEVGQFVTITFADESTSEACRIDANIGELGTLPEVSQPPATSTPPAPQPPPKEPPVSLPNQLGVVEAIRDKYATPLGASHPGFLIEVAKATGAKLLRKNSGTHVTLPNGVNVSQDILMFGDQGVDILTDGENTAKAVWQEKGVITGDYIDVSGFGNNPTPVPPPAPPTDLKDILARLDAIELALRVIDTAFDKERERIHAVEVAVHSGVETSRTWGHSHKVKF